MSYMKWEGEVAHPKGNQKLYLCPLTTSGSDWEYLGLWAQLWQGNLRPHPNLRTKFILDLIQFYRDSHLFSQKIF